MRLPPLLLLLCACEDSFLPMETGRVCDDVRYAIAARTFDCEDDADLAQARSRSGSPAVASNSLSARMPVSGVLISCARSPSVASMARMCDAVGHPVVELARIRFGPLALDGLEPGAHRRLTDAQVESMRAAARTGGSL